MTSVVVGVITTVTGPMSLYNSQKPKWIGRQFGIFCIFFVIACGNYHFYLTNEFTPGGDGGRIYLYLKYMEKVPEIFPFWHAHKHHGYPLLADPENHMPWSLILNTDSSYFNIHLNLIFFFLAAIFAFTCRSIARMLSMSQIASLAVGVITILCVPVARVFMHGTLTGFLAYVLIFMAILALMIATDMMKAFLYLLLPASISLSWCLVTIGYYFIISSYIPAFVLLICFYLKSQERFLASIRKTTLLLVITTVFLALFSMPFLLPILDGIILSNTFATETPTIHISDRDIYNYYLNLWPFILLALIFSRGLFRRYAFLFFAMAGINYLLILFNAIQFNAFFDIWTSTPIIKNIRWQLSFLALSSIAAAFCAGIFIDSCREKFKVGHNRLQLVFVCGLVTLLFVIAYKQHTLDLPIFMSVITIIFAAMAIAGRRFYAILSLCFVMAVLMVANFNQSPFGVRLYTAKNNLSYVNYNLDYLWWNCYGYDRFTPVLCSGHFSMVFMSEYRLLLSLLYGQDINAQRPHWTGRMDGVKRNNQHDKIAQLMAIKRPRTTSEQHDPFRIYDNWIVADEAKTIEIMKQESFSPEGPIILAEPPDLSLDTDVVLQASAELTGKTADTITLHVKTNKNSIVLVPEIYHRDWKATVNGKKTPIIKAYASMRAVGLPPGEHAIAMRFVYRPFYWGLIIASASLLLAFILIYFFKDKLQSLLSADGCNSKLLLKQTQ